MDLQQPLMCLVDYDNIRTGAERTQADVADTLAQLRAVTLAAARSTVGHAAEVSLRLYGGWLDEQGVFTARANQIVSMLHTIRGRHERGLLSADLALSTLCRPNDRIVGTARRTHAGLRQKMVDSMIVVDVIHAVQNGRGPVLLMSDDDDLVPAVLMSHTSLGPSRPLYWMRTRAPGVGLNDKLMKELHVRFLERPIP